MPLETLSKTLPTSDVVPLTAQAIAFDAFEELMTRIELLRKAGGHMKMKKVLIVEWNPGKYTLYILVHRSRSFPPSW